MAALIGQRRTAHYDPDPGFWTSGTRIKSAKSPLKTGEFANEETTHGRADRRGTAAGRSRHMHDRLADSRAYRLLTIVDINSRECVALEVGARFYSDDVVSVLKRVCATRGKPSLICR